MQPGPFRALAARRLGFPKATWRTQRLSTLPESRQTNSEWARCRIRRPCELLAVHAGAEARSASRTRRYIDRHARIRSAHRLRHRRHPDPRPPRVDGAQPPPLPRGARGVADVVSASHRVGRRQRPRLHRASSRAGARRACLRVRRRGGAPAEAPPTVATLTAGEDEDRHPRTLRRDWRRLSANELSHPVGDLVSMSA
jgi:hypothetical protein